MTASPASAPPTTAVRAVKITKRYGSGPNLVTALRGVSVEIRRGEFVAVMGPSGSGKSTLIHCLAGLDTVDSGEVFIGPTRLSALNERGLTMLRRLHVGFVFQQFNLVPTLTALENITLPMTIAGRRPEAGWLEQVVATVGLADRLGHRPHELSGGQQQRVACARAVLARPDVIFADEPTGNLDSHAGADVLALLRAAVDTFGQTVVMVTHDPGAATRADRTIQVADGTVVTEVTSTVDTSTVHTGTGTTGTGTTGTGTTGTGTTGTGHAGGRTAADGTMVRGGAR